VRKLGKIVIISTAAERLINNQSCVEQKVNVQHQEHTSLSRTWILILLHTNAIENLPGRKDCCPYIFSDDHTFELGNMALHILLQINSNNQDPNCEKNQHEYKNKFNWYLNVGYHANVRKEIL